MSAPMVWNDVGLCAYSRALALQEARVEACRRGGPDVCLALEHPPTVTIGRRGAGADLRVSTATLAAHGIACELADRGGGVTYHGPGQLVLYPIVALARLGLGVAAYVWTLEQIMIDVAAAFGVRAERDRRGRGVWTSRGKLGAVGIRVRAGIASHGLALNVAPDLAPFDLIVPCGMRDASVTSLAREGVRGAAVATALPIAERACRDLLASRRQGAATAEARV
jgi:lipoate-protein ligase B